MRIQGIAFFLAGFAAAEASASSIVSLEPSAATPSIVELANSAADPSIVAVPFLDGPAPSIIALADTPAGEVPDVISLGGPAPAGEAMPAGTRTTMPMVIRGGDVGSAYARPSRPPAHASTSTAEPLLDPNDRGTPAKRKALKRQAERLAREGAAAAQSQPDPSTEPVPLGR